MDFEAECIAEFIAEHRKVLRLQVGDRVTVLNTEPGKKGWWLISMEGKKGLFPKRNLLPLERPQTPVSSSSAGSEQKQTEKEKSEGSSNSSSDKEKSTRDAYAIRATKFSELPPEMKKAVSDAEISSHVIEKHFALLLTCLEFRFHVPFQHSQRRPRIPNRKKAPHLSDYLKPEDPHRLYTIQHQTGQGGFGSVYKATAKNGRGKVAIKELKLQSKKDVHSAALELKILAKMKHPNIVKLISAHKVGEKVLIITEFMEGGTLGDAIKAMKFTEKEISYVVGQLVIALQFLHSNSILYRDLKSNNIMLSVGGDVKLIDMGLCVESGEWSGLAGTPAYMAPEMIQQQIYGSKADIWSLGITCFELMEGAPPYHKWNDLQVMLHYGGLKKFRYEELLSSTHWSKVGLSPSDRRH